MISVIIPTHDRPGPLQRCLRGLRRQDLPMDEIEVVIVNDGGVSPRTVVDGWKGELTINLIESRERRGVSAARNIAIDAAQGEYVAFLDDDDVFLPRHLSLARSALSNADRPTLVYGDALVSEVWLEAMPRNTHGAPRKGGPFDPDFLMVANHLHTGSVIATNFSDLPVRFDEELDHCEDWDLWLALSEAFDGAFLNLGEITSIYHQVPSFDGTVAGAYRSTPTAFTLARRHVYRKRPSEHPRVLAYREWLTRFDQRLDSLISTGAQPPGHIFDRALGCMTSAFSRGLPPGENWLDELFDGTPPPPTPSPRGGPA
ncbi:glycosyltransferase family A protein [Nocardiopsis alba]|uniref:glycosyltransferase family A protein n=1 Tax=Nocardiopsis alba TaxID=53437 RepID=UPI0033A7C9AC